jgi:hypothetical protein
MHILLSPTIPLNVVASPLTWPDSEWEDPPGPVYNDNDYWAAAYPLSSPALGVFQSVTNSNPLNVSSSSPDYYSFDVEPGFYFSVSIKFNKTNTWNDSSTNHSYIDFTDPPFYADLDMYLWAQNGANPYMVGYSNYSGYEEVIGPVLINASDTLVFNITCSNSFGYESVRYSTTYNMSVVYEDKWEKFESNDKLDDLTPPYYPGGTDDEIVPGHYEKLRFSSDNVTEYGANDSYLILLYQGTEVTINATSYLDPLLPETWGLDFYLYYFNQTLVKYYPDPDTNNEIDNYTFKVDESGWYYLRFEQVNAQHYTLDIAIEDAPEIESGNNNQTNDATKLIAKKYPGMVISKDNHDWYTVWVEKFERLRVDITWNPIKLPDNSLLDLTLEVYENISAAASINNSLDDPRPIPGVPNSLRFPPATTSYRALKDSFFYIHVSSNNPFPLYYNLTIVIQGKDDWAEDNDWPMSAYLIPTQVEIDYTSTVTNPDSGFISLEGDPDWFAIFLLPGDLITVRIEFDGALADLNLFFLAGDGITILDDSMSSGSSSEMAVYNISKADTYYILILGVPTSYSYGVIDYNLSIDLDIFDDPFEINNEYETAAAISEGTYTDLILRDDIYDYYYLYLHENDTIEITLDYFAKEYEYDGKPEVNNIDLELYRDYDPDIQKYPIVDKSWTQFNESITYTANVSAKYFILCSIWGETPNSYNLTIETSETNDPHEDNDILSDATPIDVVEGVPVSNVSAISHIESDLQIRVKDDDYFVTNVSGGLAIKVEITFSSGLYSSPEPNGIKLKAFQENINLGLELLDPNGTVINASLVSEGASGEVGPFLMDSNYSRRFLSNEVFFRVFMNEGLSATYTLNITIGQPKYLFPRETVPPTKPKPSIKPFDPFTVLIPLAVGGAIIGGGTAGGLYAAKKTGYLDKGVKKLKGLRKKPPEKPGGGETGGLKKTEGETGGLKKTEGETGGLKKTPP